MDVSIAVVAEGANVAKEGNLNIFGIFTEISAQGFPATHPVLVLVTQVRARRSEQGQSVKMAVRLMDEDSVLAELEGDFLIPSGGPIAQVNNIFKIVGIQFPRPGSYAFHVLLNGREEAVVPLVLRLVE